MDLADYQHRIAGGADHLHGGFEGPMAVAQLAAAVGTVAAAVTREADGSISRGCFQAVLEHDLGELLRCAAVLASAAGVDLRTAAGRSIVASMDLHGPGGDEPAWAALPIFDTGYPDRERFPRRLAVDFQQQLDHHGRLVVRATLADLEPFRGPAWEPSNVGQLGDALTDNARHLDGYRFHDAIHLGFLAVLGWSPNLRALLRRKRKSDPLVDECDDGARAIFAEEGLAAVLARLAETHNGFRTYESVTRDAIEVARATTVGLEVYDVPGWLWRRAIFHGFRAMEALVRRGGGRLVADLDARSLTFQPVVAGASTTGVLPEAA